MMLPTLILFSIGLSMVNGDYESESINFVVSEYDDSGESTSFSGELLAHSEDEAYISGRAVLLPNYYGVDACNNLVSDVSSVVTNDFDPWIAVVRRRCSTEQILELVTAYGPRSHYTLVAIIWVPNFGDKSNTTWQVPSIVMNNATVAAELARVVTPDSPTTVLEQRPLVVLTLRSNDENKVSRAYAKTVVFVAFCIMSFCIMTMYCRLKLGTMQMDMRNQLWIMSLSDAQRFSEEELEIRKQMIEALIQSMPVRLFDTASETNNNEDNDLNNDEAEACVICLDVYEQGCEVRRLPCGHEFHVVCIDPWLYESHNCPLCKFDILENADENGTIIIIDESSTLSSSQNEIPMRGDFLEEESRATSPTEVTDRVSPHASQRTVSNDGPGFGFPVGNPLEESEYLTIEGLADTRQEQTNIGFHHRDIDMN